MFLTWLLGFYAPKADLTAPKSDFRFTPESGLMSDISPCPFRADTVEKVPNCFVTDFQPNDEMSDNRSSMCRQARHGSPR